MWIRKRTSSPSLSPFNELESRTLRVMVIFGITPGISSWRITTECPSVENSRIMPVASWDLTVFGDTGARSHPTMINRSARRGDVILCIRWLEYGCRGLVPISGVNVVRLFEGAPSTGQPRPACPCPVRRSGIEVHPACRKERLS